MSTYSIHHIRTKRYLYMYVCMYSTGRNLASGTQVDGAQQGPPAYCVLWQAHSSGCSLKGTYLPTYLPYVHNLTTHTSVVCFLSFVRLTVLSLLYCYFVYLPVYLRLLSVSLSLPVRLCVCLCPLFRFWF